MTARELQNQLRGLSSPEAAALAARFFKTAPGQYSEGDIFLGLRAAEMHRLAREHRELSFDDLRLLLRSPVHEDRMMALLILVRQTQAGGSAVRKRIYTLYLSNCTFRDSLHSTPPS